MRNVVYYIATTVDHYIADEAGEVGTFLTEGDHIPAFFESLSRFDSVLMGTNTYAYGFKYGMEMGKPAYPDYHLKNYIFSRSMEFESTDEVVLVKSNPATYIKDLKQAEGKDIWLCGGGALAGYLLDHEVLDELILKINPVVQGKGIALFGESTKTVQLEHYDTKTYESGAVFISYKIRY